MIFVLELPSPARAWFAYDEADLLIKVAARAPDALAQVEAQFGDRELQDNGLDGNARRAFLAAAALRARGDCRIFWAESEATAAFEDAGLGLWQGEGWRARCALRDQLVALEVLADDL
jgi:hypothetical protein